MRLRRLHRDDYGVVLDLDAAAFGEHECRPDVGSHTAWWVVDDDEGKPCAYAGAMLWEPDSAVYLHRAGVLPHARGRGLQRKLIYARERWARAKGAACSYTYTSHLNTASANNLIACGYKLWLPATWGGSRYPSRPSAEQAWLYWIKTLTRPAGA